MASPGVSPSDVADELRRVLASAAFQGASRSRQLLQFIVEETLQGRAARLKDYTLGAEVLGRGEGFDPRLDPIARVEASRLRSRLELYYATDGAADPLVISLPKGAYVPVFAPASTRASPLPPVSRARRWAVVAIPTISTAIALIVSVVAWRTVADRPPPLEARLELTTPPTTDPVSLAVSPDGRFVVFVATDDGRSRLWLRSLDATTSGSLTGTDYASLPFWAPDSRSIGFFADGKVKRIDIDTGLVQTISTAAVPAGASWNPDGVILHSLVPDSPIYRTSASGAAVTLETTLEPGQTGHRAPHFLPDGKRFLFYAMGTSGVRGIYVAELGSASVRRLLDADTPAVFARPSHLLYVHHGTLFAQEVDLDRLALVGGAVPVAEGVASEAGAGIPALSASIAGPIAYRTGVSGGKRQFVWFDRNGLALSSLGAPESHGPGYPSMLPDGRRVAVQRTTAGNTDIWLLDLERHTSVRFTIEPQADIGPLWSPQGDSIVYSSQEAGVFQLFRRQLGGMGREELLLTLQAKQATDWSQDGRFLLFRTVVLAPQSDMDIWALSLERSDEPFAVVRTPFEERDAQFSPDGRWIAYQSNESGQHEIYIQPFPGPGERTPISRDGGVQARWRADGRELYYLALDGQLVAVPITPGADGQAPRAGAAVALFHAAIGAPLGVSLHQYSPTRDGQRFLMDTVVDEATLPITLILNWTPRATAGTGLTRLR